MKDTLLFDKISEELEILSRTNHLSKINNLVICVNHTSNVNEESLYKHLHHANKKMYGTWTNITIERDDLPNETAILKSMEGDKEI